jgi:NAD-dependent dihydropyrimidine dehydrogenase PreA subunit
MAGKYMNIPREEIPWFPMINKDICDNCGTCIDFCSNGVFELDDIETKVVAPYNCVVGCSSCQSQCPNHAITFPATEELVKVLRELRSKYPQTNRIA